MVTLRIGVFPLSGVWGSLAQSQKRGRNGSVAAVGRGPTATSIVASVDPRWLQTHPPSSQLVHVCMFTCMCACMCMHVCTCVYVPVGLCV